MHLPGGKEIDRFNRLFQRPRSVSRQQKWYTMRWRSKICIFQMNVVFETHSDRNRLDLKIHKRSQRLYQTIALHN
jgi:hypothetical protein